MGDINLGRTLGRLLVEQGEDAAVARLDEERASRQQALSRDAATGNLGAQKELADLDALPADYTRQQVQRLSSGQGGGDVGTRLHALTFEDERRTAETEQSANNQRRAASVASAGMQRFRETDAAIQRAAAAGQTSEPQPLAGGPQVELAGVSTAGAEADDEGNRRRRRGAYGSGTAGINI